jgi:hypothetical protein
MAEPTTLVNHDLLLQFITIIRTKSKPTFVNHSGSLAVCPALLYSALYIHVVIFRALSISVSHIVLIYFLPPSILAMVLAEAWGGRDWDNGDDES